MEKRWSPFSLTKRMITDGFLAEQSNSETDTECSDQSLEVGEIFRVDSETLGVRISLLNGSCTTNTERGETQCSRT